MLTEITESEIEQFAVELLKKSGYKHIYAFNRRLYGSKR